MKSKFFVFAAILALGLIAGATALARSADLSSASFTIPGTSVDVRVTAAIDTDGDGIVDNKDECPTIKGTPETHGCFENNVGPLCASEYDRLNADPTWGKFAFIYYYQNDYDCDGVLNSDDNCPNDPGYYTWGGCPFPTGAFKTLCDMLDKSKGDFKDDRDCDGVKDEKDSCPDVAGYYTHNGCMLPLMLTLAPRNLQPLIRFTDNDTDGDGVVDSEDACPDTPGTVENHGCPELPAAVADSDHDGVIDADDECPDTPAGAVVNSAGCPDTDGDGIFDNVDACKDEAASTEDGCPAAAAQDTTSDTTSNDTASNDAGAASGGGCTSMLVNTGNSSDIVSALIFAISLAPLMIRRRVK